ncbi:MAG: alpha/beta hydrolase fold domain-containing protein [Clostridia bacterium]|nr:alpha/beta hydrolase fold domain-containing protein [Clostridia bacterium]
MAISPRSLRKQLLLIKNVVNGLSLKSIRRGQNLIGELMDFKHRGRVIIKKHAFESFDGAWVIPKDARREGVIMYIHGGGFTCGGMEYATGFGSTLAVQQGVRVFCPAYRLAPESPYPCALDDTLESYFYLLEKGYSPEHITLCGESAGGGLCYSLCLRLRDMGKPLPAGIIALSPWTDLTQAGESYEKNRERDPSMTVETLEFYASSYVKDKDQRKDPYVSPYFADLSKMPPSLVFSGEDEIMLSDATELCEKLRGAGCECRHIVKKERWHAYLLYGLSEDMKDHSVINKFLNRVMAEENKLRWMPLDNAAKIYPAARRQNWSNVFRLSATMSEEVDREILSRALDITVRRFPSIAVRLRRGMFWYYLEQISEVPEIMDEVSYPLRRMSKEETGKCAFRVIIYKRRIAVEMFHSLTDGNGAWVFLKTLDAEYVQQRYGIRIPPECGVLARLEEPDPAELEDSFQKYAGNLSASRQENTAWHLYGTPEEQDHLNVTCFGLPVKEVIEKAHEHGASLTSFLCAAVMMALQRLQAEKEPRVKKRKPIKVLIPVNLRNLFESRSLRNFAMYTTPEILPALGEYSFDEICSVIRHNMGANITPKQMSMMIAANVNSERFLIVRLMPLFVKNFVMKAIFDTVGERKSCLSLSNLGAVKLPEEMKPYVERFDFVLGVQATAPYNCGVVSYKDTLYINFIRNIKEPELEMSFYRVLREMGLCPKVESNLRDQ